jgi:O-antigen/teichoic acid export membrane protein
MTDTAPAAPLPVVSLMRSGLVLGIANAVSTACGYGVTLVLSRALGTAEFGALGALLAIGLIGTIPAGALQVVCARWTARSTDEPSTGRTQLALGAAVGVGLLLVSVALSLPLRHLLHLSSPLPVILLGSTLLPMTMVGALQGRLLGTERFGRLAAASVISALARLAAGILAALLGFGVGGVMALTTVGGFVALGLIACLARADRLTGSARIVSNDAAELGRAIAGMAGLLVLSNLDVVLARHYLSHRDSGLYALASIFTKAAFWGPQFMALLIVPRMSRHDRRQRLLKQTTGVTIGLGLVVTLAAATLAEPVIRVTAGPAYTSVASLAWAFALLGVCTALLQLLLYASLAVAGRRMSVFLWSAAAVEIGLVALLLHGSIAEVVTAGLLTSGGLLCVVVWFQGAHRLIGPD